jgi:hypothetical protein
MSFILPLGSLVNSLPTDKEASAQFLALQWDFPQWRITPWDAPEF